MTGSTNGFQTSKFHSSDHPWLHHHSKGKNFSKLSEWISYKHWKEWKISKNWKLFSGRIIGFINGRFIQLTKKRPGCEPSFFHDLIVLTINLIGETTGNFKKSLKNTVYIRWSIVTWIK